MKSVIGVDLGGTKIAAAVVSARGSLLSTVHRCNTPAKAGRAAMLDAVAELVHRTAAEKPADTDIVGVGIGSAGIIDSTLGTVVSSTDAIVGWAGTDIVSGLRERLLAAGWPPIEITVENDVDAYALGEAWKGAGKRYSTLLTVAVGTGVGGAVFLCGSPLRGRHHVVGEIGHMPVPGAENERCTCGRYGHLEGIAAGPQIHRRYLEQGGDPQVPDTRALAVRAAAGDELAQRMFTESAQALGKALAGVATVIDPDAIIISGGLAQVGQMWWQPLRESFANDAIDPLRDVPIVAAQLGEKAPILGAAYSVLESYSAHVCDESSNQNGATQQ